MKKASLFLLIVWWAATGYGQPTLRSGMTLRIVLNDPNGTIDSTQYAVLQEGNRTDISHPYISNDTLYLSTVKYERPWDWLVQVTHMPTGATLYLNMLNMPYGNHNELELTQFTPGDYVIDWKKITTCQAWHKWTRFVWCNFVQFEQFGERDKDGYPSQIRVKNLRPFARKVNR